MYSFWNPIFPGIWYQIYQIRTEKEKVAPLKYKRIVNLALILYTPYSEHKLEFPSIMQLVLRTP